MRCHAEINSNNFLACRTFFKSLLMPLFLMGCFPVDFQEVKRALAAKSVTRPIKVGKRPIKEGKRPIKGMVLVGSSMGCLVGCFQASSPWRKTAPLKRPIKRSVELFAQMVSLARSQKNIFFRSLFNLEGPTCKPRLRAT